MEGRMTMILVSVKDAGNVMDLSLRPEFFLSFFTPEDLVVNHPDLMPAPDKPFGQVCMMVGVASYPVGILDNQDLH